MSANRNGIRMPRPERAARVRELKENGLTFDEIARLMGVTRSAVTNVYYDPTGEANRARKERYCGTCPRCGARTSYHSRSSAPVCRGCATARARTPDARKRAHKRSFGQTKWSDEAVFEALRSVAVGGVCSLTAYESAYDLAAPGKMPSRATLVFRFGSWRNAVEAAGLSTARRVPTTYVNRTPNEGILLAIEDCAAVLGRWPGARDYGDWARGGTGVTLAVIRQRFGTWTHALEQVFDRCNGEVPS